MKNSPGPRINPALERHPRHATLIGKIILAYGEIEFSVCRNAGKTLDMLGEILTALYKTRASSARVEFAQSIIAQECKELGLAKDLVSPKTLKFASLWLRYARAFEIVTLIAIGRILQITKAAYFLPTLKNQNSTRTPSFFIIFGMSALAC